MICVTNPLPTTPKAQLWSPNGAPSEDRAKWKRETRELGAGATEADQQKMSKLLNYFVYLN